MSFEGQRVFICYVHCLVCGVRESEHAAAQAGKKKPCPGAYP